MDASEIDIELEALGSKAEQLRALYEQYFMGLERIEPLVMRKDIERRVRILRREKLRNTAQRFKFNTLVQRFNTMQQYWARIVREIENGTYRRDVIRAAARFGEGALTVLGKKKTKELVAAVAQAQAQVQAQQKRRVDEPFELEADNLIEEEEDDDADVPTPPRGTRGPESARLDWAASGPAPRGLGEGDLPVVSAFAPAASTVPVGPVPKRAAGLRWGGSAPIADAATPVNAAAEVKRRVADLAAQLGAPRSDQGRGGAGASFGELDLDFDEAPKAAPKAPSTMGPAPRPVVTVAASPPRPATTVVASRGPAAAPPSSGGFGVLDLSLEGDVPPAVAAKPTAPAPRPQQPAPANRPVTTGAPAVRPPPVAAPPAAGAGSELPDQRIRQIYAKYVEAKRSTQESTAGVTYEKLAASLRAQADKLKSAHPNKAIDYEVVVRDGKTHLKPVLR